jgi:hypothetical protein
MSVPSLAVTAVGPLTKIKKISSSLAMSTPSLAVTADGELENKNYWLACDVCALVGHDRHSACHLHTKKKNYSLAGNVYVLVGHDRRWQGGKYDLLARLQCLRPRWP